MSPERISLSKEREQRRTITSGVPTSATRATPTRAMRDSVLDHFTTGQHRVHDRRGAGLVRNESRPSRAVENGCEIGETCAGCSLPNRGLRPPSCGSGSSSTDRSITRPATRRSGQRGGEPLAISARGYVATPASRHSGPRSRRTKRRTGGTELGSCRQLGFEGELAQVVFWLIGLKSTSGEASSKYFKALQAAACDYAGVTAIRLDDLASPIYEKHSDVLRRWVAVQYELPAELLVGIDEVVLHRGDTICGERRSSPPRLKLWPLASFATDYATAASFAERARSGRGGTPLA